MIKGNVAYRSSNKIIIGIAYKTDFFVSHDIKFIMNKILVCKKTDFTNLNMLTNFKAVVTSYGGVLSHASIYCRELKIPCIVGAQNILTEIKTGDKIELNMATGEIKLISE